MSFKTRLKLARESELKIKNHRHIKISTVVSNYNDFRNKTYKHVAKLKLRVSSVKKYTGMMKEKMILGRKLLCFNQFPL